MVIDFPRQPPPSPGTRMSQTRQQASISADGGSDDSDGSDL